MLYRKGPHIPHGIHVLCSVAAFAMGCRYSTSKSDQEQLQARRGGEGDVQFSHTDIVDIQSLLWNLIIVGDKGQARSPADLKAIVAKIKEFTAKTGYAVPAVDELACRLLTDTSERESGVNDVHVVHKLETEDQVLRLLMADTRGLKVACVEVLLEWYVETADCAQMVAHHTSEHPECYDDYTPIGVDINGTFCDGQAPGTQTDADASASSLQSFVWKGSPDITGSFQPSSLAQGGFSFSTSPSALGSFHTPRNHLNPPAPHTGTPITPTPRGLAGPGSYLRHPPQPPRNSPHPKPDAKRDDAGGKEARAAREEAKRAAGRGVRPGQPQAPAGAPYVADICTPHNRVHLEHLAFTVRAAMRSALRRYSTSGHDEVSKSHIRNSQRMAGSEWSRDRAGAIARCGSLSDVSGHSGGLLEKNTRETALTVVLDLDETLVYARKGPLWVRPGVPHFLQTLKALNCEVVCWTASNRSYAGGILSRLDPLGEIVSQCIYSHPKWTTRRPGPQIKSLQLIGRDLRSTIIIDNLPDAVIGNEANAIVVENYEGCELHDNTLPTLAKVIADIIASRKSVPAFLKDRAAASHHLKLTEWNLCNGGTIQCYMLNSEPSTFSLPL